MVLHDYIMIDMVTLVILLMMRGDLNSDYVLQIIFVLHRLSDLGRTDNNYVTMS